MKAYEIIKFYIIDKMQSSLDTLEYGDQVYLNFDDNYLTYHNILSEFILAYPFNPRESFINHFAFTIIPFDIATENKKLDVDTTQRRVKNGDCIKLFHQETNKLLTFPSNAKIENNSKTFRIEFDSHTDFIKYESSIYLKDTNSNLYVRKEKEIEKLEWNIDKKQSFTQTTTEFPKINVRRDLLLGTEKCFSISDSSTTYPIKVRLFKKYFEIDSEFIHVGDTVRFKYNNHWLTFYSSQENKPELYFENFKDEEQSQNISHSIFQILRDERGNPIKAGEKFVIRHVLTGMYLHYKPAATIKMLTNINNDRKINDEQAFCEVENPDMKTELVGDKLNIKIKFNDDENSDYFIKLTEEFPIKNKQFEMNTIYFFGFYIPEEYTFKTLKKISRMLAETNNIFEEEGFNLAVVKVDECVNNAYNLVESYSNLLSHMLDLLTAYHEKDQQIKANTFLNKLVESTQSFVEKIMLKEHWNQYENRFTPFDLPIIDKIFQNLIRELRVFDHIHYINFLLIKREVNFDTDGSKFIDLYKLFWKIIYSCLKYNPKNRFYNSQFIRIYIHFIIDESQGIFEQINNRSFKNEMKSITLKILKLLLWDEDLDGLGQLNFYNNNVFNSINNMNEFQTYYLDLVSHISNSKAYNLTNLFRDIFITTYIDDKTNFKNLFFEIIDEKTTGTVIRFSKQQASIILSDKIQHDPIFDYFFSSIKVILSLTSSESLRYFQRIMSYFDLMVLYKIINDEGIHYEFKMLIHLLITNICIRYFKCPVSNISQNVKFLNTDSNITQNEELKIIEYSRKILQKENHLEYSKMNYEFFREYFVDLFSDDCSIQISLMKTAIANCTNQRSLRIILFYIKHILQIEWKNIDLLNEIMTTLINLKSKILKKDSNLQTQVLPKIYRLIDSTQQKILHYSISGLLSYAKIENEKTTNSKEKIKSFINGIKQAKSEILDLNELLSINEPRASCVVINYLHNLNQIESKFLEELRNYIFLNTSKEINEYKEIFDIALELNDLVRDLSFEKETSTEEKIKIDSSKYELILNLVIRAIKILYDVKNLQNEYSEIDQDSIEFFENLKILKSKPRDDPFCVNPDSIRKNSQDLFRIFNIHSSLLKIISLGLNMELEKPEFGLYLIRLILIAFIIFVYKNQKNQDCLVNNHGFVSLYYQQKYIDKSCDTLTLFAEVMRDNMELLKIEKKFIYDITCYTFLGTIKPRSINQESGAYLATTIMSMHFLQQANIPKNLYESYFVAETKYNEIFSNPFNKLNLITNQKFADIDPFYYNIRELLKSSISLAKYSISQNQIHELIEFRKFFKSQKLLGLIQNPEFRFQFELKAGFFRLIRKVLLKKISGQEQNFFDDDSNSVKDYIIHILHDIVQFGIFMKFSVYLDELRRILIEEGYMNKIKEISTAYEELRKIDLNVVIKYPGINVKYTNIWKQYIEEESFRTLECIFNFYRGSSKDYELYSSYFKSLILHFNTELGLHPKLVSNKKEKTDSKVLTNKMDQNDTINLVNESLFEISQDKNSLYWMNYCFESKPNEKNFIIISELLTNIINNPANLSRSELNLNTKILESMMNKILANCALDQEKSDFINSMEKFKIFSRLIIVIEKNLGFEITTKAAHILIKLYVLDTSLTTKEHRKRLALIYSDIALNDTPNVGVVCMRTIMEYYFKFGDQSRNCVKFLSIIKSCQNNWLNQNKEKLSNGESNSMQMSNQIIKEKINYIIDNLEIFDKNINSEVIPITTIINMEILKSLLQLNDVKIESLTFSKPWLLEISERFFDSLGEEYNKQINTDYHDEILFGLNVIFIEIDKHIII